MLNKFFNYMDELYYGTKALPDLSPERFIKALQFVGIGCLSFVTIMLLIYGIYVIGDKLTVSIQNNCMFVVYDKCRELNLSRDKFNKQNNNIRKLMDILCYFVYLLQCIAIISISLVCLCHLSLLLAIAVSFVPVYIIFVTFSGINWYADYCY